MTIAIVGSRGLTVPDFTPYLPEGVNEATVSGFKVGGANIDVIIVRGGDHASTVTIDTTKEANHRIILSVQ